MFESTYKISRCDICGNVIDGNIPENVRDRIANGFEHPFIKNMVFFVYYHKESGNFYRVERTEHFWS